MWQTRSFYRSDWGLALVPLALAALLLASACAPGTQSMLTGVGCPDPSCNEVDPETRKVIGCIGEACNEPPPPGAEKQRATTENSSRASQSTARSATAAVAPAPPAAPSEMATDPPAHPDVKPDSDADESSLWNIKIYYESYNRP